MRMAEVKRYRASMVGASIAIAMGVVASALLFTAITPSLVAAPFGIFVLVLGLVIWIPFHEYNGCISAGILGAVLFIAGVALPFILAFSKPPDGFTHYPDYRNLTAAARAIFVAFFAGASFGSAMWLMSYRRKSP